MLKCQFIVPWHLGIYKCSHITTRISLTLDLSSTRFPVVSQLFLKFLPHCTSSTTTFMFVKVAFLATRVSTPLHRILILYLAKNKDVSRIYLQMFLQLEKWSWEESRLSINTGKCQSSGQHRPVAPNHVYASKSTQKAMVFLKTVHDSPA